MSAAAARSPIRLADYERANRDEVVDRCYSIGAHADFRREDFVFPRMQSRAMKETPWAQRTPRMHSWSELVGIGLLMGLMSLVLAVGTASLV